MLDHSHPIPNSCRSTSLLPHQDQGWIFAAFNAGLLCMLFTGFLADKFNAKCLPGSNGVIASSLFRSRHDHRQCAARHRGQYCHPADGNLEVRLFYHFERIGNPKGINRHIHVPFPFCFWVWGSVRAIWFDSSLLPSVPFPSPKVSASPSVPDSWWALPKLCCSPPSTRW